MHYSPTILLASTLALLASASPTPNSAEQDTAAIEVKLTGYSGINWTGDSKTWEVTIDKECKRIGNTDWNDRFQSIKVPEGKRCRLWSSNNCDGDHSGHIYAPGQKDLGGFKKKTTSFKCYEN